MMYRSCTGATEPDGKALAEFRILKPECNDYLVKQVDADQRSDRRIYMRKILINYPKWTNLSNDELDKTRLKSTQNGYLLEDYRGYEFFLPLKKVTQEETEFRKIRAMIPFEFMDIMGKDFQWGKYNADISSEKDMINKYIVKYPQFKAKGMGLYIYSGTKGSGKTMLACCLLNEIARRYSGSIKFINILDFLEITKKGYQGGEEEVKAIYEASVLVIDDIGVQMSKEWIDTVLYRLINERYVKRAPTIYTSNVPIGGLKVDDRIADRIDSTSYPVKLPDESIRKVTRQEEKKKLLEEIV